MSVLRLANEFKRLQIDAGTKSVTNDRALVIATRYFLLTIVLLLMVSAARQGTAAYYFRQNSPAAVQKAMALEPGNPVYPSTVANLIHLYSDNADPDVVIRLYQTALRISPFEAGYCTDLAQANDWAGRYAVALTFFQRAQKLFPNSPEINWKLANFYVRSGNIAEALPPLKKVLSSGTIAKNQIFSLASSARIDAGTVIDELLPPDAPTLFEYLNFQIDRGNIAAAQQTWDRLHSLRSPFQINQTFHYLDALIMSHELDRVTQVWAELVERFPPALPSPASRDNLVTNGDFRADILNGGFDWRVNATTSAAVTQESADQAGVRHLRIDFDGSQNLYYDSVVQFVLAKPNTKYDFSAVLRSEAITTDSGAFLQISDAYDASKILGATDALTGTSPRSEHKFSFNTGPDTRLLLVRVVRSRSRKFDDKIAGAFWVSRVSLVPHP